MYSVELHSVAFIGKLLLALIPRAEAQVFNEQALEHRKSHVVLTCVQHSNGLTQRPDIVSWERRVRK